ncbi:SDR family oxidoreductase [Candidatus Woesearchaeota archaeon]|nr:SDR family oxidoreductase [Candidatus Woesearchaeota archaeon]
MSTILVTGGAGFIGSHLCDALVKQGNYVICVDNLFTGSKENITHLLNNPLFEFVEHDIINPFFADKKIDQIYNLACPASPIHYQFNAIRTIKANTLGVINMLGLAKKHKARILQASTSEVYGDPLVHPQVETYFGNVNSFGPRSCYDEGKRVAESLFFEYNKEHNVDIRIARIFNTYGPKMSKNDGRVVSNFIVQALENKEVTVYGAGSQTRSFCFVSDLVAGLVALMNSDVSVPVNLGNPEEYTVLDFAKKIIALSGASSKIVFNTLPKDDPCKRKPDISRAQQMLAWNPAVSVDEGLKQTIAYFKTITNSKS